MLKKNKTKVNLLLVNIFIVVILVGLSIFNQKTSEIKVTDINEIQGNLYKKDFLFFGTKVSAQVITQSSKKANQAFNELETLYKNIHQNWHAWEKGGLLAKINESFKINQAFEVDIEVANLIEQTKTISEQSEGYFNPAIGTLVSLWGFHGNDWMDHPQIPDQNDIDEILNHKVKMSDIQISPSSHPKRKILSSKNQFVQLDMGAIAKGYAIDLAINLFSNLGIKSALVNAGGDIKVLGRKFNQPWKIGLEDPLGGNPLGKIDLGGHDYSPLAECSVGCAVATSGSTKRFFIKDGLRYSHIINPITGYPAKDFLSVTVIHPSATHADAAATALFVAGIEKIEEVAKQLEIRAYSAVDQNGKIIISHFMNQALKKTD